MLKGLKHCWNLHEFLSYLFIIPWEIELENVSLSDIWNLGTDC